jgi:indole-3-glycerol phosphate synthase / phosphoribosylanthranilate isomerase
VKSASPSLGVIREHTDLHEYARAYGRFADAVSVLTEPSRFGGSLLRLRAMRAETDLPIIAKDFMTDRRQLVAARAAGADAVLLMLSVLTMKGYEELAAMAGALGLDVLTEVSNEAELAEALSLNARIIGINNRDLRNLSIDLSRTEKLAPLVPEGRLIVSESGIKDHATIERLAPYAKAFLIGSAIGLSQDISCGVRRVLFGESKCCGITRAEDALAAARAGALRVGIVTAKRSPRCVSPRSSRSLPPKSAARPPRPASP